VFDLGIFGAFGGAAGEIGMSQRDTGQKRDGTKPFLCTIKRPILNISRDILEYVKGSFTEHSGETAILSDV
jgi:hypothetical protein